MKFLLNFNLRKILKVALVILISGKILLASDLVKSNFLMNLVTGAAVILFIKMVFDLPCIYRSVREKIAAKNGMLNKIISLVPPEITAVFKMEKAYQRGFISWLSKKERKSRCQGQVFSHSKKSIYSKIFKIVIVGAIVEVPISGIILWVMSDQTEYRVLFEIFSIVAGCYGVIWLISDRHLLNSSYHTLTSDSLTLRIGVRFFANIPLKLIEEISEINETRKFCESNLKWLKRKGFENVSAIVGTPIDHPNVFIKFVKSNLVNIESFRIKREGVDSVLVYVDQPKSFVDSVRLSLQKT